MAESMKELVSDFERIKVALDVAEEVEGERLSRRMPPAKAADLAKLNLPPSYREFLLLNDGWANFWGAMWIAGAGGKAHTYVKGQIKQWRKYLNKPHAADDLDFDRHFILGADDNGGFLAFGHDPDAEGEREVLDMPRGFAENRWPTFRAFVEAQRKYRAHDLEALTRKKKTKAAPKKKAKAAPKKKTKPAPKKT
jgi:hypothetical protein